MKIVTNITNNTNTALMRAGTYAAVVKAINPVDKVLKDGEKPELEIEFAVVGATEPMTKRYQARLDGRNPLRREETPTNPTETPATETSPVKAVIQHVENIKETLKGVLKEFAEVMDGLKVIEKEKRATDREIESVREKLREIQAVRI